MNNGFGKKISRYWFYVLWIILGCWQAAFTPILDDEAYYWRYAQDLAWGYFDHPPMTAALIAVGTTLGDSVLFVRICFVLLSATTIYLLQWLIRPSKPMIFYALVSSIAVFHAGSFMALPDVPLLFLTTVFFISVKRYLNVRSWLNVLLISIVVAATFYTKYHAILLVIAVVFALPHELLRKHFWAIVGITSLLMIPHILWQVEWSFPTLQYHLVDRSGKAYTLNQTLTYLWQFPLVIGPLAGLLLYFLVIKKQPQDAFDRVLKFTSLGIPLFFFVMSFKGRVEAHWTIITVIPCMIFVYKEIESSAVLSKVVKVSAIPILILILLGRFWFAHEPLIGTQVTGDLHDKKEIFTSIQKLAGENTVAFMNSYQNASVYSFYTGKPAFSLNNFMGRGNQYDLWKHEGQVQGETVLVVANFASKSLDSILVADQKIHYELIENFASPGVLNVELGDLDNSYQPREKFHVDVQIEALQELPTSYFEGHTHFLTYQWNQNRHRVSKSYTGIAILPEMLESSEVIQIDVVAPPEPGEYDLFIGVQSDWLTPGLSSGYARVRVR